MSENTNTTETETPLIPPDIIGRIAGKLNGQDVARTLTNLARTAKQFGAHQMDAKVLYCDPDEEFDAEFEPFITLTVRRVD